MNQSTFLWEEPPANPLASQDSEKDFQTRVATSCLPTVQLLNAIAPSGWYGRTSPVSCRLTEDGTLEPSSECWQNSGMGSPTGFLTLNTCEHADTLGPSRNGGGVSSLSDILEIGAMPRRFYLTAKACRGILRRAAKRGKQLPPPLERALRTVAQDTEQEAETAKTN